MKTTNADKWFSLYIRLRDADENGCAKCCTCGDYKPVKLMDCGHFVKRQHMATRFNTVNCATQCKRCNGFEQGRDAEFERFLIKKWGSEWIKGLKIQGTLTHKYSQFEIDEIAKHYKIAAVKLAKDKNLKLW